MITPTVIQRGSATARAGEAQSGEVWMSTAPRRETADVFVARQPIFTRHNDVHAYELLFRSGPENVFDSADGTGASAGVITGGLQTMGLARLTAGRPAFINFTRRLLVNDYFNLLPAGRTVIELLEDIEVDAEVVEACRRLKAGGYTLALDDVESLDGYGPLLDLVDIVKIDFRLSGPEQRRALAGALAGRPIELVAEKVETREEFDEAVALGFDYFQGHYLSRPVVVSGREMPPFRLNLLHLLHAVHRADFDFGEIERIVKRDVSLSYRMLQFANSVAMGVRYRIDSVRHALVMLGRDEVMRAVSLMVLAGLGSDRPQELAVTSMIRARFLESLAPLAGLGGRRLDFFLLGMFSQLDAILELPMSEIVGRLPASEEVSDALLGRPGRLRDALDMVIAYERADWTRASALAERTGIPLDAVPARYVEAVAVADEIFGSTASVERSTARRAS